MRGRRLWGRGSGILEWRVLKAVSLWDPVSVTFERRFAVMPVARPPAGAGRSSEGGGVPSGASAWSGWRPGPDRGKDEAESLILAQNERWRRA
jgi:hypothetical protein